MRKGKMILALTFLVVMVALFAAGCGGGKTTVETPKQQIIIRFYSEEAELSSAIGEVGKSVTMPQEPQKTGHVFEGWYLDNNTWQQVFDADYLKNNAKQTLPLKVFAKWVRLRNLELSASVQAGGSVQGETGSHKENEEISVRAVPNEGYTFDGWFNEGAKVSSATEYTFVMPERDYSLQAKFSLKAFQLTIESESESKGTVTGNKGSINFGTFVSVTAEPAPGYSFDGWYEDDTKVGSDVFYTFNMPSRAVTLVAKFKTEKYMLTIENSNPASGAISAGGLKSNGEAVTVTATANTGYSFAGWYEGETLKSSNAQYAFAMPAGNLTLSVRWELITYSMTYESGDGSFADGYNPPESFTVESEDVVLPGSAEISKEGYSFYKWYEDGDPTETAITIIDTASAKNYELIAVWTPNSYLLSVISGNENAGSVSGGGMKVFGSETTVTATPADQSHEFSGWYDGAVLVSTVAEYTFTMPARGLTLTARWDALIYSITYKLGSGLFAAGFTPPMGYSTDDEDITLPQAARCTSLDAVYVDSANTAFSDVNGVLLANGGTELVVYPMGKTATSYSVPADVKIIKESVFYSNPVLTKILLPNGLERIESYAFSDTKLTSLSIPASVNYVGDNILESCDNIVNLTIPFVGSQISGGAKNIKYFMPSIPSSLQTVTIRGGDIAPSAFADIGYITRINIYGDNTIIGKRAFYSCDDLAEVYIYNGVTSIGEEAFLNCSALITVVIPDSVTTIGNRAFYQNGDLEEVTISASSILNYIGVEAFGSCIKLTEFFIPSGVTFIGEKALYNCYDLTSITVDTENLNYNSLNGVLFDKITNTLMRFPAKNENVHYSVPDGVTGIADFAFASSRVLSVIIPGSVTTIGLSAFNSCGFMTSFSFATNSQLLNIGEKAFYSCIELLNIDIPDTVTHIGISAFHGCVKIETMHLPLALTEIPQYMLLSCHNLISVNIPSGITSIGKSAFHTCENLESTITIPAGVQTIGITAFYNCKKINAIYVDTNNQYYKDVDGILYDKSGDTLIVCPAGKVTTQLILPYGVTQISDNAFSNVIGTNSIILPETLQKIGDYAFIYCSGLTSMIIPSDAMAIGYRAFYSCSNLIDVTFEATTDWFATTSSSGTSGTDLTITDPVTNALYLKTTYVSYYWKRNEQG